MKIFYTNIDVYKKFDCDLCEPIFSKKHWWASKLTQNRVKADVVVRTHNPDKTKRDYIYLCSECFTRFRYRDLEYLIEVIANQDKLRRIDFELYDIN